MKQYEFEKGDLELLALGLLSEDIEQKVVAAMENDLELRLEYEAIEDSLLNLALENEIKTPEKLGGEISDKIFSKKKRSVFSIVLNSTIFRVAASVLLIGSVLGNIYFVKTKSASNEVSSLDIPEKLVLGSLPFEQDTFEEMFAFLSSELAENPCEMDFRTTKHFLEIHHLNTPENIKFLQEHNGHCDCEVLMNVAQYFPESRYHHGSVLPKTHMRSKEMAVSFLSVP